MVESMKAFAKRTGFTYWAIRKFVLNGQLPYIMVGNRYMIHIEKGLAALNEIAENVGA